MKAPRALLVCHGGPNPTKFKYMLARPMNKDIGDWLQRTFRGYGQDYYYSHGEIWFKTARQQTLFVLRWPCTV